LTALQSAYISIAALEGGNTLRVWVKLWSVGGNVLHKRLGGDSIYLSLEEIRQQDCVYCPFCDKFDWFRLRTCLAVMEKKKKKGNMPMVKDMTIVRRHRH
jgi:hypothetical protein